MFASFSFYLPHPTKIERQERPQSKLQVRKGMGKKIQAKKMF